MLDNQKRSELEQAIAGLSELLPRTWKSIYNGCLEVGFDSQLAMDLVKTYILSQNPFGIRPPNDGGAGE